jgi:dTDP-4-amino-4,6-dideoxygalactose transaminase
MNLIKPISISLSPNTEKDDVWLAFKLLFLPWRWKEGKKIKFLEEKFKKYLKVKHTFSFNSGRSALLAILDSLKLEKESEILVQSFTCNAAINPIIWFGLKPVYVDCDEETFNIDIDDLKKKITSKTRVIMVQHTFGLPIELDQVLEICKEKSLILIEDCAHSLGAKYKNRKVGTFGRASFFSFGRDKVISSVYGGIAVTNDPSLAKKLRQAQDKFGYPSYCWIFQQLLHPVLMNWLILPTYSFLGKYLLILFQKLNILSKAVYSKEKMGLKPSCFPKRLPNALAILALNQLKKIERFNAHRKEIADFYRKELKDTAFELPPDLEQIYLRFTIKHPKSHKIIKAAWKKNILIGDWYTSPIVPDDTNLEKINYQIGSCPKAEKLARETLNLPTHINISQKQAQEIIDFLKTCI